MAHLSVVVPVYKAENCLEELYRRLVAALEPLTRDFELVLVEDAGGDRSWEIIRGLAARDKRVRGLQFTRNFGQHYGITAGLDYCDGDWVVVMDGDLQDPPEEIPRLYAKAREGWHVVVARRGARKHGLFKRLSSSLFYAVFRALSDVDYDSSVGNFRILSRRAVERFRTMREQLRFFGGLVHWLGFPAASVDVRHAERHDGKSTYTFKKLRRLAGDAIIAYSDKPLRLSIRFGFLMSFTAFVYGLYVVARALRLGSPVMGWPSLMASLYFLSGVIIVILGIIGIYLGKTFDEIKKRPLYVILHDTSDAARPA